MDIKTTSDYSLFKTVVGNRKTNNAHVNNLIESIGRKNLLGSNPIIVNEKMEVIDGQHRLEAAKALGIPVPYTIQEQSSLTEVISLNANNRAWITRDYLNSHIARGNEEYKLIEMFSDVYGLPISICLELLGKRGIDKAVHFQQFKAGEFKVVNLKSAEEFAQRLTEYKEYLDPGLSKSRDFIRAVRFLYEKGIVEHKKMMKKLLVKGAKIKRTPNLTEMYRQLEDIYNYKNHDKVRFF